MTISKKPSERGELIVRVNVEFPKTLSSSAKEVLKDVLPWFNLSGNLGLIAFDYEWWFYVWSVHTYTYFSALLAFRRILQVLCGCLFILFIFLSTRDDSDSPWWDRCLSEHDIPKFVQCLERKKKLFGINNRVCSSHAMCPGYSMRLYIIIYLNNYSNICIKYIL